MKRTIRLIEQMNGETEFADVNAEIGDAISGVFSDIGYVASVQVDEMQGKVDFGVDGMDWKASVCLYADGSAKVTVHDTSASGENETLAIQSFKTDDIDTAIAAVYEYLASNIEEE